MGDESSPPSRSSADDTAGAGRPDGGTSDPVEPRFEHPDEAVVPVFEEPDGGADTASRVIPRFDPPAAEPGADEPLDVTGDPFDGILPTFDEPDPGAFSWQTPPPPPQVEEDSFGISGPEYDQEMPLADHIEEMVKRLAVVIVVAGSVSLVVWPFTPEIINFLWYSMLPGTEVAQPRVYGPLEFLLTRVKVASLVGLVIALPVLVYETYAFMRPGLYPHERKYYLAAIPTSLVLAVVGVFFAYFIVLPALFSYFLNYSQDAGEIAFALSRTFDLILILMGYLAVVFQIPLLIMLGIMIGVTSRRWLASKRLYFWGAFLGLSFISSPDPTGMAPFIIALTMVGLFEGTLGVLKWVGR